MRLFIAIPIPATPPLRHVLRHLAAMHPNIRTVAPDALHLTLRFLGDVPEQHLPALRDAFEHAIAHAHVRPFEVHLNSLGRFPDRSQKPPRVIFAAVSDPTPITQLAQHVNATLDPLDIKLEAQERELHPHLTLARIKPGRRRSRPVPDAATLNAELARFIDHYHARHLASTQVSAIHLMQSTLTPAGPIYASLHQAPLPR